MSIYISYCASNVVETNTCESLAKCYFKLKICFFKAHLTWLCVFLQPIEQHLT